MPQATSFELDRALTGLRAAQYIRMSTDYQRYSTEYQRVAISAYAALHQITIVDTYSDDGRSGLQITGRPGLQNLIARVQSGSADFGCILVYDVSRWGRFQDTDESAYYEYICRKAGIRIEYCAEQFENDGSLMSTIIKGLKRAMAAEYSRELSTKVFVAQCRIARLGFWQGGPPTYGLRRELVDEHGCARGFLTRGERKYLQTDRVILRPGSQPQLQVVRHVFQQFAQAKVSEANIARELNRKGIPNQHGRPWRTRVVNNLLKNENYIGTNVYNRTTERLGRRKKPNPPDVWIRGTIKDFEPVVEPHLFWLANKRFIKRARILISDDEMLDRLASLLKLKGRLSARIINGAERVPCVDCYTNRFGSLARAYELIGHIPKDNLRYTSARRSSAAAVRKLATDIAAEFHGAGLTVEFDEKTSALIFEEQPIIILIVGRCFPVKNRWPRWTFYPRFDTGAPLIIAARMDQANENILDYLLLPTDKLAGKRKVDITVKSSAFLERYRVDTVEALVALIFNDPRGPRERATNRKRLTP